MRIKIKKEPVVDIRGNIKPVHSYTENRQTEINAKELKSKLEDFVLEKNHPCLMAQSVFQSGRYSFGIYRQLGRRESAIEIQRDLRQFLAKNKESDPRNFSSFIAVFVPDKDLNEEEFEARLWQQLQYLHEEDANDFQWDPKVGSDPKDPHFSFSLMERAFFIIGLHPRSSRMARQFSYPAIVFNLHEQFETLREMKAYEIVRDKIRSRDEELQGSINPMLSDYGHISEARQYSGRKVGDNWKCPFLNQNG